LSNQIQPITSSRYPKGNVELQWPKRAMVRCILKITVTPNQKTNLAKITQEDNIDEQKYKIRPIIGRYRFDSCSDFMIVFIHSFVLNRACQLWMFIIVNCRAFRRHVKRNEIIHIKILHCFLFRINSIQTQPTLTPSPSPSMLPKVDKKPLYLDSFGWLTADISACYFGCTSAPSREKLNLNKERRTCIISHCELKGRF
jgi:hypothetical protein